MADDEEREEEGEEERGGGEGQEEEALGTKEPVRGRGRGRGGAPLPLHCSVLWPARRKQGQGRVVRQWLAVRLSFRVIKAKGDGGNEERMEGEGGGSEGGSV